MKRWKVSESSSSSSSIEISSDSSPEVMPTKKWEFKATEKSKEQKEQVNPNFKEILQEASTKPIE